MTKLTGKVSWFGGPDDTGVDPDEGLAFIYEVSDAPHLFLPKQPPGTSGLARRLDPEVFYIATRWDYDETPKDMLPTMLVRVKAQKTGREHFATPADWGPHEDTDRIADISPGLMAALGIDTDDIVEVSFEPERLEVPERPQRVERPYDRICMSSGHSTKCQGADSFLNEVAEATRVVDRVAEELQARGVGITTFHDTKSTDQDENLDTIVDWHNAQTRDLDVSVHFNASTGEGHGTEVWYVTQQELSAKLSAAIAKSGFRDRGAKYTNDFYVLNHTEMPAVLIEVCFVDNPIDADIYDTKFADICRDIADVLGGPARGVA
jgi:N-acetylmuramoyl-L-alanine amidase